jgi:dTDP-4-dehydrorhamnose 3,5-epimerase-like enzyme
MSNIIEIKNSSSLIKFVKPDFTHKDDRGFLTQITSKGKWNQINYIESKKNCVRGNHYHQFNRELFYVIEGRFYLTLEKDDIKKIYDIIANDMFIIEPFVTHSFEYIEKTMLITMYDKGVELQDGKMDMLISKKNKL